MMKGSKEIGRIERCVIVMLIGGVITLTGIKIPFFYAPCWWADTILYTGLLLTLVGAGALSIAMIKGAKEEAKKRERTKED